MVDIYEIYSAVRTHWFLEVGPCSSWTRHVTTKMMESIYEYDFSN